VKLGEAGEKMSLFTIAYSPNQWERQHVYHTIKLYAIDHEIPQDVGYPPESRDLV
jgi:hypothetical protein